MNNIQISQEIALPVVVQLDEMEPQDFVNYYNSNKKDLEEKLHNAGAIKFKGVKIESIDVFQEVVNSISDKFLAYVDGNSPRTKLSGNVYTSTEYDQTQRITMHNELSYSAKWPNKLFFNCLIVAETGGETLLANSREILREMNSEIIAAIKDKGVTYIRNLHGGMGMGPSWQDTFETDSKEELEAHCKSLHIDIEWMDNDNVRLRQPAKGIIKHKITGEEVWFNQVDQFHPYHLGEEVYEMMQTMFPSPEEFPMYVTFGDGSPIREDMIKEILQTIDKVSIAPAWETNELLIVDNELVSHGRNPFTGERRVLVSMSE